MLVDAKSELFSRVELHEVEGTKIEERLIVEDLDEDENTPVGLVKEEQSKPQPITKPDHEKEAEPIAEKAVLSDEENEPILSRYTYEIEISQKKIGALFEVTWVWFFMFLYFSKQILLCWLSYQYIFN